MAGKFLTNWGDDENKALTEWIARAAALGIDITTVRPILRGGARESVRASSDSVAVREALRRAAACRCGEQVPDTCGACIDLPEVAARLDKAPEPATNPLRALRTAAKLTQREAADRVGIARRTWQIAEASAAPSAALVAKARKVLGKAGAK
jgi:DNA-binding XRE family transcriptional regulator